MGSELSCKTLKINTLTKTRGLSVPLALARQNRESSCHKLEVRGEQSRPILGPQPRPRTVIGRKQVR